MAQIASLTTLHAEIKAFGGRVFELTRAIESEPARAARRASADASRALSRTIVEAEERRAARALQLTFKALSDAVLALDAIASAEAAISVDASALAAEGAGLCDAAFDCIARG